ncbi:hypothetical protein N7492_010580 [Penicillium capsulatum]|uniref:Uncharacterized protein n=1 Tax=Penicillium capsulatum TaxID=69766 RepID=A0A9W9LFK8_9EURO|nr:hypothetical protein N7492_010580 [Penicillium capsulatum]KAJ6113080.1 hypothetical protein N7512_008404 [Penicillium capsulatum]
MRRATAVGERLSPRWRNPIRRTSSHVWSSSSPSFALNLTGRINRHTCQSTSSSHWLSDSRLRKRCETFQYDMPQEFHSTSRQLEPPAAQVEDVRGAREEFPVHVHQWNSVKEEADYSEKFHAFLENGQPNQVMSALTDPRSAGLVGSLPQIVFIEALHRLSPSHFVDSFRDLHHPLHSWAVMSHGMQRIEEIFDQFVHGLLTVARYRTDAGHYLGLAEFTHFLDCARSMGNGPFADMVWDAMKDQKIRPDATCYNHYMETKAWDHCYTGGEAYHLRIMPFAYKKRRSVNRTVGWRGYGTAGYSVRRVVTSLFSQMLEDGHLGDERTYINMIIASARVGHQPGMFHILKEVWNVDAEALAEGTDPSHLPPATPYDAGSALHPTENLLFAIAHAFGTNNDIPRAVRTIQFISSSYNIPVTAKVWHEIFERSYVLSRKRDRDDRPAQEANEIGPVSMGLVSEIFNTMTSSQHNVTPTMQTWRFMINIAMDMGSLADVRHCLRKAYDLLTETRRKETQARKIVERCLEPALKAAQEQVQSGAGRPDPALFQSPILADAIQAYDIIRLESYQQAYLLRRVVWVAVRVPKWQDTPDEIWQLQERPKFMEEWVDFMPDRKTLFYADSSGFMEMDGPLGFANRFWTKEKRIAIRRETDREALFHTDEELAPIEGDRWTKFLARKHPYVDTTIPPLNRLFNFQLAQSAEFKNAIKKLGSTWVEYPENHPHSKTHNPRGGFWGRLAALDMLKPDERGIYLLDDKSWI